jgi:hypothetical protein
MAVLTYKDGGCGMATRQFKIEMGFDEFVDLVSEALKHNAATSDVVGSEITVGNPPDTRRFTLIPIALQRYLDTLTVEAQDQKSGDWMTVAVSTDGITAQVVS